MDFECPEIPTAIFLKFASNFKLFFILLPLLTDFMDFVILQYAKYR